MFGATFASFLNVLILRYPHQPPTGRSHCPRCRHQLTALDLVPIISWLMLRGQCRHCHARISLQYPLVEISGAIVAGLEARSAIISHFNPLIYILLFLVVSFLIVLFVIDLRTMLLPDIFIFILTGLILLTILASTLPLQPRAKTPSALPFGEEVSRNNNVAVLPWGSPPSMGIYQALIGAALGSGLLLILWFITSGRGIGFGDVKIMIPLGMLFGPINTVLLLFTAFICGGFLGTYLLVTKQATLKTAVPFGPFLAGVAIIFILFPHIPADLLSLII
ncbi:MAG: Type 4 prepilin-like protein leader peptide processing enzyme [Parcubacteria group bacterium GW2011_GWA2_45_14]|nr:MAG: Type 4 prepilin-like protein leader peptide processing enzyme [Parcubacteria group bacterium GW2011_GWA2_45_14]